MKETNRNRANVAKRRARQRKLRNRRIALTVCLMLVVMVASIGGTVAWLTASTTPVVNTFTYGDINITLTEEAGTLDKDGNHVFKIVPGVNITKDPKVTVTKGSEACWLFVKIDEVNWPTFVEADGTTKKIAYNVATGWTALEGQTGVYYREVEATTNGAVEYSVLKDNKVTVSQNLTKTEVNGVKTQPKLTFTAYAVQKDGIADAATAWLKVPQN